MKCGSCQANVVTSKLFNGLCADCYEDVNGFAPTAPCRDCKRVLVLGDLAEGLCVECEEKRAAMAAREPSFLVWCDAEEADASGNWHTVSKVTRLKLSDIEADHLPKMAKGDGDRIRALYELAKLGHLLVDGEIVDVHQRDVAPSNVIKIDFVARAAKHAAAKHAAMAIVSCSAPLDDCNFIDSSETDADRAERIRRDQRRVATLNAPLVFREKASGE